MNRERDFHNARFLLQGIIGGVKLGVEALGSPMSEVAEVSRRHLDPDQVGAVEASFSRRREALRSHVGEALRDLGRAKDEKGMRAADSSVQQLRSSYFLAEMAFDYYVDLVNTRAERGMGAVLKGCDRVAHESLRLGLEPFGMQPPPIITYVDRGQGASILKAGIYLWDGERNPAAVIKCVRYSILSPRLTALLHESGHQFAHMRGWNQELAEVLRATVLAQGGKQELAGLWASWSPEVAADFIALHQANFASVVALSEVVAGTPAKVFLVIPNDSHPMSFLRVLLGLSACTNALGSGPWDEFSRLWHLLYPVEFAGESSRSIVQESIPLLGHIARSISNTKMKAFSDRTLNQLMPWERSAPSRIAALLRKDRSDFSAGPHVLIRNPIQTLAAFRVIQMFGGRSEGWIRNRMRDWLIALGAGG